MDNNRFDFIIIGNGLAGFQLALEMAQDAYFDNYSIALIDPSSKDKNDKTWCFWENDKGKWDDIIHKKWHKTIFSTKEKLHYIQLVPYCYKMLRSIDFYQLVKATLLKKSNFEFILEKVTTVDGEQITTTNNHNYSANKHIFDSRLPKEYFEFQQNYNHIHQHFKGWFIETNDDYFDTDCFTTMDYTIKHQDDTTFTYVLPITKRKALIEFTFFTPYLTDLDIYDQYLKKYINDILKIDNYKIVEVEQGNIPMTDFPFTKYNSTRLTKIGTGGGWVKASTGYSFKHTEKKVAIIVSNLKRGLLPSKGLIKKKFTFYDRIFLNVLKEENDKGEWIFKQFYTRNNTRTMFKFLDEESSIAQDLRIMGSLFSASFIKAFLRQLIK